MNWAKCYQALVERARCRVLDGYTESHHVTPRCIGGEDGQSNLVRLTAREHYTAHLLLVKMYPDNQKLAFAAHMMTVDRSGHRIGNRKYEWLRKRHSAAVSASKVGNKYGTGTKRTAETRARMSKAMMGGKGRTGLTWSDEQKKALSAASIGRSKSATHCDAMALAKLEAAKMLPAYSDGSTRVPGITQRKNGAFIARGRSGGKRVYLGFFWNIADAMAAIEASK